MKADPILEELWKVKDQLAAEAGYDVERFLAGLRAWEAEHRAGRIIRSDEELRELVQQEERKRAEPTSLLKEEPPLSP